MTEHLVLDRLERLTEAVLALGQKQDRFEARLVEMEERFDAKLAAMEERFDAKLGAVEERLEGKIEAGLSEVRTELRALSARVDIIKEAVDALDERLSGVDLLLAYHQDKLVEHDKEIWKLKRRA